MEASKSKVDERLPIICEVFKKKKVGAQKRIAERLGISKQRVSQIILEHFNFYSNIVLARLMLY